MASKYNAFFEASGSEESEDDKGYDSEAAEQSKGRTSNRNSERAPKRRRVSSVKSASDEGDAITSINDVAPVPAVNSAPSITAIDNITTTATNARSSTSPTAPAIATNAHESAYTIRLKQEAKKKKKKTPGVIYLSSVPPYLRPSALRNLLTQRGFGPINRLFLAPASKATRSSNSKPSSTKSSKRQLYSEGWIEFASKSTAKRCAETLNAAPVGGKKGGFYRDDVWNMKYLRGMGWEELMAGVREERREEEGRRDEERLILARETKRFIEGVERGRKMKGIKESRAKRKREDTDEPKVEGAAEIKRTWRQFEVKGKAGEDSYKTAARDEPVSDEVKRVLGKIF
jgi:ESF2/ABP1 family protein